LSLVTDSNSSEQSEPTAAEAGGQSDAASAAPSDSVPSSATVTSRVLLVDDNQASRMMFTRVVQKYWPTWNVVTAANDADATRALADGGFDWFVLDIVMPDFDGIEFAGRVIASGIAPDRVIIMSASDYELNRIDGAGLGDVKRCSKPPRVEKFVPFFGPAVASNVA
jgi:CheY-like chemotaxis protein